MVVLTARDEKRGLEALESLKHSGLSDYLVFHQLDVADPKSIASLADFVKKQFGKLDILVNSRDIWSKATDDNYELAEECLKTNYNGAKRTAEALIPLLQLSDLPRIVNVSSSVVMLKGKGEKLKGVLTGVTTEEKLNDLITEYLKDFKEGLHGRYAKTDINLNTGTITAEEGAVTPVKLALLPKGGPSGLFFVKGEPATPEP
ncbi:hypothetical protein Gotur_000767 [Gossypium turneri]